ncbi:AfsR/SARP family transcriptional regulator [Streptosporangium saharense]|uniref:DNA-binding SARP family transcriptional activator n=1 Tax=Streptosporangium saharense TaxID=1706840 RepID=A0A7W7QP49_9ACTN|nr:BTAD domain-containing putative transcriptional regulator [Streptosporangium saharense]MBB4916601.1 DNA-binding SARP family transcriptional activator [Streptosporangium saharense]
MLGPLRVLDGERDLTPGPAKHRALLAALLLRPARPVAVERLIDEVWDGRPPASAEPVLRVYVSALRKVVEGIRTVPGGYLLDVDPGRVDAHRFEHLVAEARRAGEAGRRAEAAEGLREALTLWRGPALADVESDTLRRAHAVRLEELRLTAVEERVELDLTLGRGARVVGELRALVAAHPLRERAWGQLIAALDQAGRRSEALGAYREARRLLVEELGLEPGEDLRAAHERVLTGSPAPRTVPNETPPDIADFTGREHILEWIRGSVPKAGGAPVHLVLHGPAGVGKSAVAVHAATALDLPDGRLYASLGTRTPEAVLEDLLRSVGCPEAAIPADLDGRVRLYRSTVGGRRLLVVLDDAADEAQVRPLLPTGPGCVTLVTSRSPLPGLEAARALELDVLDRDESVAMLAGVAGEHRVRAEPEAAARVAELCGGLPLALRIAGSRLARRPGWTLAHLAGRLGDERGRLDELSAGDLAVRGSLALGYRALSERQRLLLRRLGALSAPDVAPWVASALLGGPAEETLDALAGAGLLQARGLDPAGQERYGWHDLTRLYAAERLAEEEGPPAGVLAAVAPEILERARRARTLLLPAEPGSGLTLARTAEQITAPETALFRESARWLAAERGFLVATVADARRAGLDEVAWRLAFYLTPFFELGAHREDWRSTVEEGLRAVRRAGHRHGEALLLRSLADLHRVEGRLADAAETLRLALTLAETGEVARTRYRLGLVHLAQDRLPEAQACFVACLAAFSAAGDRRGRADALRALGGLRREPDLLSRSLEAYRELGDPRGEAAVSLDLAGLLLDARRLREARGRAEHALGLARRLGDRLPEATALVVLAGIALAEGGPDVAKQSARQALETFREHGDRGGAARATLALAEAALGLDEIDEAFDGLTRAMGEFDALGDGRGRAMAEKLAAEVRRRRGV